MEPIPYHPLIHVTQEEITAIRQSFDLDIKKINEILDAIEDWCRKQDHLVEALPYLRRDMLERFLILGRGSIERTKIIIDKALTIRGMLPDFFPNPSKTVYNELRIFLDFISVTILPKPNPKDNTRIILVRIISENCDGVNLIDVIKFAFFLTEIRMHYDYNFTHRIILDGTRVKSNVFTKMNPVLLKKAEVMFSDVYKFKIKGVHTVNVPPFANKLLSIIKQIVKEKIIKRIHIHNSYEELHQEIPRKVLPIEYGGEEVSCSKLTEQWIEYLKTEDARRLVENYSKIVSNESRRSCVGVNEEYLGMPGSFKQLNVD